MKRNKSDNKIKNLTWLIIEKFKKYQISFVIPAATFIKPFYNLMIPKLIPDCISTGKPQWSIVNASISYLISSLCIYYLVNFIWLFHENRTNTENIQKIGTGTRELLSIARKDLLNEFLKALKNPEAVKKENINNYGTLFLGWNRELSDKDKNIENKGPQHGLYAIDRFLKPIDWWSNGMLAYRGLLSLWERKIEMESLIQLLKSNGCEFAVQDIRKNELRIRLKGNEIEKPVSIYSHGCINIKKCQITEPPCNKCGRINRIYIWPKEDFINPIGANLVSADRYHGHEVYIIKEEDIEEEELESINDFLIWDIGLDEPSPSQSPDGGTIPCYGFYLNSNKDKSVGFIENENEMEDYRRKWLDLKVKARHIDEIVDIERTEKVDSFAERLVNTFEEEAKKKAMT